MGNGQLVQLTFFIRVTMNCHHYTVIVLISGGSVDVGPIFKRVMRFAVFDFIMWTFWNKNLKCATKPFLELLCRTNQTRSCIFEFSVHLAEFCFSAIHLLWCVLLERLAEWNQRNLKLMTKKYYLWFTIISFERTDVKHWDTQQPFSQQQPALWATSSVCGNTLRIPTV